MWALSVIVSLVGAWVVEALSWPLPWLIGPLLVMLLIRCMADIHLPDVKGGRRFGQWVIATSLGLHFTSEIVQQMMDHWFIITLAASLTTLATLIGMVCLKRAGCDRTTAYFASLPGGASEMVNIACHYDARLDQVAAVHSLRIVSVVLIVPPIFNYALSSSVVIEVPPVLMPQLVWVLFLGALTALVWRYLKQPNPWMLGPLFCSAVYTVVTKTPMSIPSELSKIAQLLIGLSLGSYFDRQFIRTALPFLLWTSLYILLSIILCAVLAWGLAWGSHMSTSALVLGMAPGGITELSITAEALGMPVALVAAIQVLRLLVVMFFADPIFNKWIK